MELQSALPVPLTISATPSRFSPAPHYHTGGGGTKQDSQRKQQQQQQQEQQKAKTNLETIVEMTSILRSAKTHQELGHSLAPYQKTHFRHTFVIRLLLRVRDPDTALAFLLWAKNVCGYKPSIVVWNNLLGLFVRGGRFHHLQKTILDQNKVEKSSWNEFTYGWLVHAHCMSHEFDDAYKLIDEFRRTTLNQNSLVVLHNMMIKGLSEAGLVSQAKQHLQEMDCDPNLITYNTLLAALCKHDRVDEAHAQLVSGMSVAPNSQSFNVVVAALAKSRNIEQALSLIELMHTSGVSPNTGTYNPIIESLCKSGRPEEACKVLETMLVRKTSPSIVTLNIILHTFCKACRSAEALTVADVIAELGLSPTIVTYNALLELFLSVNQIDGALELLETMGREKCKPSFITYSIILDKAVEMGRMAQARALMQQVLSCGYTVSTDLCNKYIGGLCKAGEMDSAVTFLKEGGCKPDVEAYNMLVDEFCKLGKIEEAEKVLEEMIERGCIPDEATYSVLIEGLCNANQVEHAFEIMQQLVEAKLAPGVETFVTLIDRLCQEKEVEKAVSVLSQIPEDEEALGVCKALIQQTRAQDFMKK